LAYSVWSEREVYSDVGALIVTAGTSPQHAREVLSMCLEEVEQFANDGPTPRELKIAQGNLRADLLLSAEDSGARMSFIASEALFFGRVRTFDEIIEELQAVTADDVRLAAQLVATTPPCLGAVGPIREEHLREALFGGAVSPSPRRRL
jgi:predicted Zn-dependent peptidase